MSKIYFSSLYSKTLVQPASASKRIDVPGLKERMTQPSNEENKEKTTTVSLKEKPLSHESRQGEGEGEGEEDVSQPDVENKSEVAAKGKKRMSEPCEKEPKKKKTQSQEKKCRRKLLPQIKGQQQINRFFRM